MHWTAVTTLLLSLTLQEKPLPDRTNFLIEFQVKRQGIWKMFGDSDDAKLLAQYTYKETVSEMALDSNGKTRKTQCDIFERIPTRVLGHIYRRQIVNNGVPLTRKELDKQDRQNEEALAKQEDNIRKSTATFLARWKEDERKFEEAWSVASTSEDSPAKNARRRKNGRARPSCKLDPAQTGRRQRWKTVGC